MPRQTDKTFESEPTIYENVENSNEVEDGDDALDIINQI